MFIITCLIFLSQVMWYSSFEAVSDSKGMEYLFEAGFSEKKLGIKNYIIDFP